MAKTRLTEDQLKALVDQEVQSSLGYVGRLSAQRQNALIYYNAQPKGDLLPPEIDGRSAIVSTDLSDTIEWMMPQLMRIFTQSDDVVEMQPQTKEQTEQALDATAYCNYVFYRQNAGFMILHNWFKDALLSKNGIIKVFWDDKKDVTREEYECLTEQELHFLLQDKEVEIVEQRSYPDPSWRPPLPPNVFPMGQQPTPQQQPQASPFPPSPQPGGSSGPMPSMPPAAPQPPMLYDVTVQRSKNTSQTCIEGVPPEEFIINRGAKSLESSGGRTFVGQRLRKTRSELKAMGHWSDKELDEITTDDNWAEFNQEKIERTIYDDEWPLSHPSVSDPSQKIYWLTECYYNVDWDGDGISELRHIIKAGSKILTNEAADDHPYCSITPIPMQHRFFGRSLYDVIAPIQRARTSLLRSALDSLYLTVNPRMFAVEGQVNLDDLLMSRPGGVVRMKQQGMAGPLEMAGTADQAFSGLQFCDQWRAEVTGVSQLNQGTDQNILNKTASGQSNLMEQSNQRIEMIARVFAETGVTSCFRKMLRLASEHCDRERSLRLNGEWKVVDPREWKTDFDMVINVGLGSGNKGQQAASLGEIIQAQMHAAQYGLATPKNAYNALTKWVEAKGFKNSQDFFDDPTAVDPQTGQQKQPPPQQPAPQVQVEQMRQQGEQAKMQQDAQTRQQEIAAKAQADQQRLQMEDASKQRELAAAQQVQQSNDQRDAERSQMDGQLKMQQFTAELQAKDAMHQREMQAKDIMHQREMANAKEIAWINAQAKTDAAEVSALARQNAAVSAQEAAGAQGA